MGLNSLYMTKCELTNCGVAHLFTSRAPVNTMCKESEDPCKGRVIFTNIAHFTNASRSPCMQKPHNVTMRVRHFVHK